MPQIFLSPVKFAFLDLDNSIKFDASKSIPISQNTLCIDAVLRATFHTDM